MVKNVWQEHASILTIAYEDPEEVSKYCKWKCDNFDQTQNRSIHNVMYKFSARVFPLFCGGPKTRTK